MSVNLGSPRTRMLPSFAHLRRLTDDTGILEHALGRIPRRREGYTTDDNARALWTATEWLNLGSVHRKQDEREELHRLTDIYLAFMLWAQDENGWFKNNFAYDRTLEPEEISHDCQGRSFWACADAWIRLESPQRDTAKAIVERCLPTIVKIDSLRGQAFAMAASAHLLEASDTGRISIPSDIESELRHHLPRLEKLLNRAFRDFYSDDWRWFEPAMTYSNGVLPWAMLRTYRYTRNRETMRIGLESLSFLLEVMTSEEGWFRPVGNEGWCTADNGSVSRWDQQPLELFKLALALEEARVATGLASQDQSARLVGSVRSQGAYDVRSDRIGAAGSLDGRSSQGSGLGSTDLYFSLRERCIDWYYGDNDLGVSVVDPRDGSCCDGLTKCGPNINCGAEATISYLMTEALCQRY
ncbi:hypothetical protein D7Z26_25215 [Cohnella endophytica]|uniref:Glycosyl hydrolase n=1 Tax=Cohnella endophytica TaxID=2419778 RepID=A0A494X6B2_9BACL|nr:hypothetical protein [Cohnella endophytica]RKP45852.1 hypothetical protein D7Z26_25215 [Cohnella endophytica]